MMLIPSIIAFFVSLTSAILVQKLFLAKNKIDTINHRSSHTTLATRTGGISIFLSLSTTSFYFYFLGEQPYDFSLLVPLGIMFAIGIYDDFYNIDFKLKFFIQIIVAKILIDQGLLIDDFHGFLGLYKVERVFAQAATGFVFLLVVNSINLVDGIDGLALFQFLKVIIIYHIFSFSDTLGNLTYILILAIIPLFYFNFRTKNKIFLGDAGSLLLGTLIMTYLLNLLGENYIFKKGYVINKTLFSVLLVFYPLIDLLRVFILRVLKGNSPFKADKNHLHHVVNRFFDNHFISSFTIIIIEVLIIVLVTSFV